MNVLVNAVSIKEGGPLVVLRELIAGMQRLQPETRWFVAGPPPTEASCSAGSFVQVADVLQGGPISLVDWYERLLPSAVRRFSSDVVFSLTNYLPLRKLSCPAVLLEQHAGHFSAEFQALDRQHSVSPLQQLAWRYKNAWVRRSVRSADKLMVQTAALADRIAASGLRPREKIAVVAHGPGQVDRASGRSARRGGPWRIGYLAKFGVQKNFETLFRAARRLSDAGHDIRVVLTLDPSIASAARTLSNARALGIAHRIDNLGEVRVGQIQTLYDDLDIMAFCSVCESFGFPMVEAMVRGLPIVVADTPENREITGAAALRFARYDDCELARHLASLIVDDAKRQRQSEQSLVRGRDFSWQRACEQTLSVLNDAVRGAP